MNGCLDPHTSSVPVVHYNRGKGLDTIVKREPTSVSRCVPRSH